MRDLVILVADKNTEFTILGAIQRHQALGIRPIEYQIVVDPGRDGGVRRRGAQILAVERAQFTHAVMLLDYEGCGAQVSATELTRALDQSLSTTWGANAKAIVIEPEVDRWIWGNDTHIQQVIDWDEPLGLRDWLRQRGFAFDGNDKPDRPKEALEAIFHRAQLPRSSAQYRQISERLSLRHCQDVAFLTLNAQLVTWFPAQVNSD